MTSQIFPLIQERRLRREQGPLTPACSIISVLAGYTIVKYGAEPIAEMNAAKREKLGASLSDDLDFAIEHGEAQYRALMKAAEPGSRTHHDPSNPIHKKKYQNGQYVLVEDAVAGMNSIKPTWRVVQSFAGHHFEGVLPPLIAEQFEDFKAIGTQGVDDGFAPADENAVPLSYLHLFDAMNAVADMSEDNKTSYVSTINYKSHTTLFVAVYDKNLERSFYYIFNSLIRIKIPYKEYAAKWAGDRSLDLTIRTFQEWVPPFKYRRGTNYDFTNELQPPSSYSMEVLELVDTPLPPPLPSTKSAPTPSKERTSKKRSGAKSVPQTSDAASAAATPPAPDHSSSIRREGSPAGIIRSPTPTKPPTPSVVDAIEHLIGTTAGAQVESPPAATRKSKTVESPTPAKPTSLIDQ